MVAVETSDNGDIDVWRTLCQSFLQDQRRFLKHLIDKTPFESIVRRHGPGGPWSDWLVRQFCIKTEGRVTQKADGQAEFRGRIGNPEIADQGRFHTTPKSDYVNGGDRRPFSFLDDLVHFVKRRRDWRLTECPDIRPGEKVRPRKVRTIASTVGSDPNFSNPRLIAVRTARANAFTVANRLPPRQCFRV